MVLFKEIQYSCVGDRHIGSGPINNIAQRQFYVFLVES